jgi:hypothetical protein
VFLFFPNKLQHAWPVLLNKVFLAAEVLIIKLNCYYFDYVIDLKNYIQGVFYTSIPVSFGYAVPR